MKKVVSMFLAAIMLLAVITGMCSCGEKIECDYCEKEFNKTQAKTKVYDGDTLTVCKDCAGLIQDYVDGKAVECSFCDFLVKKKEAHTNEVWGETIYMCQDCYDEIKEAFE